MAEYGIFLLKTLTIVVAIAMIIMMIVAAGQKQKQGEHGQVTIRALNQKYKAYRHKVENHLLNKSQVKKQRKQEKKAEKIKQKDGDDLNEKPKVFVLKFKGDIQASGTESLREEITTILASPVKPDEVVVQLESAGGVVHGYGLAASQLVRLKDKGIRLTVCVDKVAASGGYMMACVADKVLAAPFAIVGSIGVVAQMPNIHRLLKKHDVDVELHTAGQYKRTLTVLGENTDEARKKFKEDLNEVHRLFKEFIQTNRSQVDLDIVATGEYWMAIDAKEKNLVDELITSDQYLQDLSEEADLYHISYKQKKSLAERMGKGASEALNTAVDAVNQRLPF